MKFLRLTLLLGIVMAMATSCKKPVPDQVKHIPKNASFVMAINTKAIGRKLMDNQATLENILRSATGTDTTAAKGKQEWQDLQESGINLTENFYIAATQKGGTPGSSTGTTVMAALGLVKDQDKLEKYIKKKMTGTEVRKEKDYSFVATGGDKMVAWNKDMVIALTYQQPAGMPEFDSATGTYNFKKPVNTENNLKTEMDSYFTMKEDQSVAAISEFRELSQNSADATMWVNAAGFTDMISLPRVKELFENTYSAYTLNFEDGKVIVDGKTYLSKQLKDIYDKYKNAVADMSLIEKYPSDKITGFFVAGFDPQLINDIVKQLELGGMADMQLTKMMGSNYTLQDLLKAFKGDVAFVASDFSMKEKSMNGMQMGTVPQMKTLLNIAIGDQVQMNKLLDKMVEFKLMDKGPGGYTLTPQMKQTGFTASVDAKNILVASNDTLINDYRSGSKKAVIGKDILSNSKDKSVVFFMDIQNLMNGFTEMAAKDSVADKVFIKGKETFKDFSGTMNKPGGKAIESHYELRFMNEKENSLTSILKFAEVAASLQHDKLTDHDAGQKFEEHLIDSISGDARDNAKAKMKHASM